MNLYDLLILGIKKNPQMYTGNRTLKSLNTFINGYILALKINNITDVVETFEGFNKWVTKKYAKEESVNGWCSIILEEVEMSDDKGFNLFFDLLEEYFNCIPTSSVE